MKQETANYTFAVTVTSGVATLTVTDKVTGTSTSSSTVAMPTSGFAYVGVSWSKTDGTVNLDILDESGAVTRANVEQISVGQDLQVCNIVKYFY